MDPTRFALVKEIFSTAAAHPDGEREIYLERACRGDPDLQAEVRALLAQRTIAGLAGAGPADPERNGFAAALGRSPLPARVGPYRILGVLGEGGMGVVYRAEQTEPIHREVALKLVRRGGDPRNVMRRFEAERQTLARMDHPNIARVLDAGSDEHDEPYFVMELVPGVPVTEFCTRSGLRLRERLELFRSVCVGVRHAHQKGVIHRDLKPSNVLVTLQDGAPVPKIIDFGIAKAVGDPAREVGLTGEGQLVGTVEYMSPEQTRGVAAEVDARSDVYSLGVILYELVTGRLPHETRGLPILEAIRRISEQPPEPLRETATGVRRVDSDVETIVLKALEKDPERRYSGAAELAEDVGRYLASQPILGRPPSTMYQMKKLVARHRLPFVLATALVALLVTFAITMSVLFSRQSRERERAEAEAGKAHEVNDFLRGMLASVTPSEMGLDVTVREVLREASRDIGTRLAGQPEIEAAIRATIGDTYLALGEYDEAELHLARSLDLRRRLFGAADPELATSLREMAVLKVARGRDAGELAAADSLCNAALSIHRERLGPDDPSVAADLHELAGIRLARARFAEAESLCLAALDLRRRVLGDEAPEVAETLAELSRTLVPQGRLTEAEEASREVLRRMRSLYGDEHPAVAAAMGEVADHLSRQGRYTEADSLWRESIAMERRLRGDDHPLVARRLETLASHYLDRGMVAEAEPLIREALSTLRARHGERSLAAAAGLNNLGRVLDVKGEYAASERSYREALDIWKEAGVGATPTVATCLDNLGGLLTKLGKDDEAEEALRQALEVRTECLGDDHVFVANSHNNLAVFLMLRGRFDESAPHMRRALELWKREYGPDHPNVATATSNLGFILWGREDLDAAADLFRTAIRTHRDGGDARRPDLAIALHNLAGCLRDEGRFEEAEAPQEEAVEILRDAVGEEHFFYAEALRGLGSLRVDQGRTGEAEPLLRHSVDVMRRVLPPGHPRTAAAENALAACLAASGRSAEAKALFAESDPVLESDPGALPTQKRWALRHSARFWESRGDDEQASRLRAAAGPER